MPYADPERKRQNSRDWHCKNRQKANAANRKWRERNPDRERENHRRYYEAHKEAIKSAMRLYHLANREKQLARMKKNYYKNHSERLMKLKEWNARPDVKLARKAYDKALRELLKICPHCGGEVSHASWKAKMERANAK